ncbi:MAG TPA: cupin domain-containing protein [Rhizomicrobium sp.]|nr:cupin domain-containing protein [Rhizomicrobium sp.]
MTTFDLESTYLGLDGAGRVTAMPGGDAFWRNVDKYPAAAGGTLVTVHTGEGDWTSWEMHPHGDEVLVVLEGHARMIFERPDGDEEHALAPGTTLIIPAGTWHMAREQKGLRTLFITYGKGTSHKPA